MSENPEVAVGSVEITIEEAEVDPADRVTMSDLLTAMEQRFREQAQASGGSAPTALVPASPGDPTTGQVPEPPGGTTQPAEQLTRMADLAARLRAGLSTLNDPRLG